MKTGKATRETCAAAAGRNRLVAVLVLGIGAMLIAASPAEIITRKDGRKIEGQIVREEADAVIIQTTFGQFRIARDQIASITGRRALSQSEREAEDALAAGNLDRALAKLQEALKEATTAASQKALQDRIAEVNKMIQEREEKEFAFQLSTADRLIQEKRFSEARDELKRLLERNPDPSPAAKVIRRRLCQAYLAEAQFYKDTINYPEATDMYKRAIEVTPDEAEPYLRMARFLVQRDAKPAEIIEYYTKGIERALKTEKESALLDDYYKLGIAYIKAGSARVPDEKLLREGIRCLLIVSRDGGTTYTAFAASRLEDAFVQLSKTNYDADAMIQMLQSTLEINPNAQKARWILAEVYGKKRDYEKVIEHLTTIEANAKASNDVIPEELYYRLGLAYLSMPTPNQEKALEAFENEIRQNRLNYMALIRAAELHAQMGTYDDALRYCNQAIALRKERPEAYLVAAETHTRRSLPDDTAQAQRFLRQALNLKADFHPARIKLAAIDILAQRRAEQPNYANAQALLFKVLADINEIPPSKLTDEDRKAKGEAIFWLARIEDEKRNWREAANMFKSALTEYPNFPEGYRYQGNVLIMLDAFDDAKKSYLKAVELEPANPETYLLLGKLCQNNLKKYAEALSYYKQYLDKGGSEVETVRRWMRECESSMGTAPAAEQASAPAPAAEAHPTTAGAPALPAPAAVRDAATTPTKPVSPAPNAPPRG
ncbi:MAG: tetratricopeptide repeat protein [Candidatus Sumerlaeia bacterium]|nr:tetratricopeptide repeat protein [Candidatus Sumerlaeia bacterium]